MRHKKGTGNSMEIKRNKGDEENKSMVRELVEL